MSLEYQTLVRCTDTLTLAISADPLRVASKLLEVNLISLAQLRAVQQPTRDSHLKASELVTHMLEQVNLCPDKFDLFVKILNEVPCLQNTAKLLRETHSLETKKTEVDGHDVDYAMQHLEMEREIRGLKEKVAMQVELSRGLKEEVAIIKTQLSRMDTCLQKAETEPQAMELSPPPSATGPAPRAGLMSVVISAVMPHNLSLRPDSALSRKLQIQNAYLAHTVVCNLLRSDHLQTPHGKHFAHEVISEPGFKDSVTTLEEACCYMKESCEAEVVTFVSQLDTSDPQICQTFQQVVNSLMDKEIKFGRIASLFFFTYLLCKRLYLEGKQGNIEHVVNCLSRFLDERVSPWLVEKHNGRWEAIKDALLKVSAPDAGEVPALRWISLAALGFIIGNLVFR